MWYISNIISYKYITSARRFLHERKSHIKRTTCSTHHIGNLYRSVLLVLGKKRMGELFHFNSELHCYICFLFFWFLFVKEKKYKKEVMDEMAVTNLRRCDSVCYKFLIISIVCIGFLSAILRFAISSEVIGYMLMGILVLVSIIRTILFCYMDAKGE